MKRLKRTTGRDARRPGKPGRRASRSGLPQASSAHAMLSRAISADDAAGPNVPAV